MSFSYCYAGRIFFTKAALLAHFRVAIDHEVRGNSRPFFDAVLADCFADRHPSFRGLRPTEFAYVPRAAGDHRPFTHALAALVPRHGWQRFSARGLLDTAVTFEAAFPKLCRERFTVVWRSRLFRPGPCAYPNCAHPAVDLDHVCPQHKEIVLACLPLVDASLREAWAKHRVDAKRRLPFQLPARHPASVEYDRLTQNATYQALCKQHHRKTTGTRATHRRELQTLTEWAEAEARAVESTLRVGGKVA